jgi:hypothetical protein
MAIDASGTPTLVTCLPTDAVISAISGYEADASTAVAVIAAPGAGKALYLLEAIITSNDDDAAPVLQDEDDNYLFGPFYAMAAGPIVVHKKWEQPRILKLVTNKALEIKAGGAGSISLYLEYATGSAT